MTHFDDGMRFRLYVSTAGDFVALGDRTEYPFTAGGGGIPAGWAQWVEAGSAADVNWTTQTGRFSVSNASATDAHNGGRYTIYRDFPVQANHRYLVKIQAQTMQGKTNAYRQVTLQGNVNLTRYGSSMLTQQSWENIAQTFTPAGDTSFRMYLQSNPYWSDPARATFDWGIQYQNVAIIDQLVSYPDPTWHEITCDSLSFTSRYGRSKFTARYDVGSCQITINNNDGEFSYDPSHEWGLRPGRFVKITATLPGETYEYPMFYGLIDSLTDAYALSGKAGVVMQCVDTSSLLSNQTVPSTNSESTTYYSGGRFRAIYQQAGWLPQMASTEPGIFIQQPIIANGRTVRDELGLIADSEGGWFFCDRKGILQYRDRDAVSRYYSWYTVLAELLAECPDYINKVKLMFPGLAGHYAYINHQSSFDFATIDIPALVSFNALTAPKTGGYLNPATGIVTTHDTPEIQQGMSGRFRLTMKIRPDWNVGVTDYLMAGQWQGTATTQGWFLGARTTGLIFGAYNTAGARLDFTLMSLAQMQSVLIRNQDCYIGMDFTPSATQARYNGIASVDGVNWTVVNAATTGAFSFRDSPSDLWVGVHTGTTGQPCQLYWMKLESLDSNGNPTGVVWQFDANEYPGTGTSFTDQRGRIWYISAAGAITPGTMVTPAETIVSKGNTWYFRKAPNAKRLDAFLGGALVTATADLPYNNGDTFWVRVQRDSSNNVRFYHSAYTGSTSIPLIGAMTQLGATLTATGIMGTNTQPLAFGATGTTGQSWPLNARVLRVSVLSTPNGSLVVDIAPNTMDGYEGGNVVPLSYPSGGVLNIAQTEAHELLQVDPDREPTQLRPVDAIPTTSTPAVVELQQLATEWSRDRVVNDVQLANQGGSAFQFVDAASQRKYGPRTYQRMDLLNVNDHPEYLITRSQDIMDGYTDAVLRVNSVQFRPNLNTYLWVLNAFLNDLVRVRYTNPRHGWGFSVVSHIQQVEHTVTPHDWQCTLLVDDPEAYNRWDDAPAGTGWDEAVWDQNLWDGFSVGQWSRDSQWNDGKSVWK